MKNLSKRYTIVDGCWIWNGAKNRKGYGQIRIQNKLWIASRYFYTIYKGDIPEGFHILHKCDTPSCVNPKHLVAGTNQENVDDKMRKGRHWTFSKTHCSKGHELTPENTRIRKHDNSRSCRICERSRCRTYYGKYKRTRRGKGVSGGSESLHRVQSQKTSRVAAHESWKI